MSKLTHNNTAEAQPGGTMYDKFQTRSFQKRQPSFCNYIYEQPVQTAFFIKLNKAEKITENDKLIPFLIYICLFLTLFFTLPSTKEYKEIVKTHSVFIEIINFIII